MIRSYKPADLDEIMKIWLDANTQAHTFIDRQYWLANYNAVRADIPRASVYIYERNGHVLGFAGVCNNYLAGIFTAPEEQSKGIGAALLNVLKKQYASLFLRVYQKNSRAIRFYVREGFTQTSKQIDAATGETEFTMTWHPPSSLDE